ncbi:hypothetical protein CKO51_25715 [Rhodopirellula sp. SM50]|nr:hypothetical protein CKO51_25715 [Rhodopirellula sp. SM50]
MDWRTATFALVIALVVDLTAVEILRSIVDRKRREATGIGGTQDIAIWGTLIGVVLVIAIVVCGTLWIFGF